MKKRNLLKTLIFFLAVTASTVNCYADDAEQTILLSVPATVTAEKVSSVDDAQVNAETGILDRSLQTIYNIVTNGNDSDYDFIITSSILGPGGETVSAYGNNGCLLFGHTINYPTAAAIADAKAGGNNNLNVIAYPVTATIDSPMTVTYRSNYKTYGSCYVIKTNDATSANLTHTVNQTPVSGTYDVTQDESGIYKATVTLSVIPL